MEWKTAPLRVRILLILLSVALSVVEGRLLDLLPWLVMLVALDAATYVLSSRRPSSPFPGLAAFATLAAGAAAAAASLAAGMGAVPLLLIPAFHAGTLLGGRAAVLVVVIELIVAATASAAEASLTRQTFLQIFQFVALALVIGVVAAWARSMKIERDDVEGTRAAEAALLLRRLRTVSEDLDTGFDAPAAGARALADLTEAIEADRCAVLAEADGRPSITLAMTGARSVRWPALEDDDGPLLRAWETSAPVTDTLTDGSREINLLVLPMLGEAGARVGLMVADRHAARPFTPDEVAAAQAVATRHALYIEVALAFTWLRSRAAFEERQQVGRRMHDGIAQDLAAFGYRIDALRTMAKRGDNPLLGDLDQLRAALSGVLGDLRLHISDLRIADHGDTRLGSVISDRMQAFASITGARTTVDLSEDGLRLPAHIEVMAYRLVLDLLDDARRAEGLSSVQVAMSVVAPSLSLTFSHDGTTDIRPQTFAEHPILDHGGVIDVRTTPGDGVQVHLTVGGAGRAPGDNLPAATALPERGSAPTRPDPAEVAR